jgi:two-component system OmpR family sensor kinase
MASVASADVVYDGLVSRQAGGGSGLGLSIVTAIVHSHGGVVELETAPGAGCVFRVLLPEAPISPGLGRR